LRVELRATRGAVHSLWLHRNDEVGRRLRYLLTDGREPVPVALPNRSAAPLWLRWRQAAATDAVPEVSDRETSAYQPIGFEREVVFADRYGVRGRPLPIPKNHHDILKHINLS
jgi:hypothetical protein